jgi:hypothetical protein
VASASRRPVRPPSTSGDPEPSPCRGEHPARWPRSPAHLRARHRQPAAADRHACTCMAPAGTGMVATAGPRGAQWQ